MLLNRKEALVVEMKSSYIFNRVSVSVFLNLACFTYLCYPVMNPVDISICSLLPSILDLFLSLVFFFFSVLVRLPFCTALAYPQ